jgi:putative membrane protein
MEDEKLSNRRNASDHLANERTFLAWVRTSIGIMGFGFVVVKFSLFTRQVAAALSTATPVPRTGYSHAIGVILVALGGLVILFAFVRYQVTKKQLETGGFYQSGALIRITTALIFLVSILLLIYLAQT